MEPLPKIAFGVTKAETERERGDRGEAEGETRDASSENYGDDAGGIHAVRFGYLAKYYWPNNQLRSK